MIVVAPRWPGLRCFRELIDLSTRPLLLLPHWENLLIIQSEISSKPTISQPPALASGLETKLSQEFVE